MTTYYDPSIINLRHIIAKPLNYISEVFTMYEITYDFESERNITEYFEGDSSALKAHIQKMRAQGCYHIDATCLDPL